jgi:hypothetical protein
MGLTVDFHNEIFLLWSREHRSGSGPTTPQSLNRYAFTGNNPVVFVDTTGHDEAWIHLTPKQTQELIDGLDELINLLTRIGQDQELAAYLISLLELVVLYAGGEAIAAALAVVGITVSAGTALLIGLVAVAATAGMVMWNAKSLQHAAQSLAGFKGKLQEAVNSAGESDRITIYAKSRTFERDEIRISSANYNFHSNDFSLWNDVGGQLINYMQKYADETGAQVWMRFWYYPNYTYIYYGNNQWWWSYNPRR